MFGLNGVYYHIQIQGVLYACFRYNKTIRE